MSQIAITFKSDVDYSSHSFISSPCNEEALAWVNKWPEWPSHCIIIYGPKSCGKSHVANIWKSKSNAEFCDAATVEHQSINDHSVVIEDIDGHLDETGLFHLYNEIKNNGNFLLLTCMRPPSEIPIALPDLKSRLNSCPAISIELPDDILLKRVLSKLFADKQLRVGQEVMDYILQRVERSFKAAEDVVNHIDSISLQEKRNVTIPLVRKIL